MSGKGVFSETNRVKQILWGLFLAFISPNLVTKLSYHGWEVKSASAGRHQTAEEEFFFLFSRVIALRSCTESY